MSLICSKTCITTTSSYQHFQCILGSQNNIAGYIAKYDPNNTTNKELDLNPISKQSITVEFPVITI